MNLLPEDVLDTIYKYKHNLEMSNVFDELTQLRINCRFLCSLNFVKTSRYLSHDKILKACIDLKNIHVESYELLDVLRTRKFNKYAIHFHVRCIYFLFIYK